MSLLWLPREWRVRVLTVAYRTSMVWTPLPLWPVSCKAPTPMPCCSNHAGTHLKAQGVPTSGPLHWLVLLSGMLYWQIAAWLTHLTPLSFCSNVTFMMPTLTPLQALPMLQNSLISAFSAALTTFYYLLITFTHEDARSTRTGTWSLFLTS